MHYQNLFLLHSFKVKAVMLRDEQQMTNEHTCTCPILSKQKSQPYYNGKYLHKTTTEGGTDLTSYIV